MRITSAALAATVFASLTAPAAAATDDGDFAVYGWGARDCETIIAFLDGEQAAQAQGQMAEWISGYISARNRSEEGIYDLTPVSSQYPMVSLAKNICANNADQLFESVVDAMVDNFSALRLSTISPAVSASHNGRSVAVNEATVLRVQEFLVSAGHLESRSADGKFGPNTAKALEIWQEDAGLTPNGLPDIVTLFLIAQQIEQ